MIHLGDITKINGAAIPPVDVITGGSPCQGLSMAGKREGLADERSGLYMEQIRIIREMREQDAANGRTGKSIRPRYMVWENVPGAFSANKGEDFRAVLEEAARIVQPDAAIPRPPGGKWPTVGAIVGDGWSLAWRVFDAQFWGVPQRRRRIALVVDFGGESAPEILFERESLPWSSEPGTEPEHKTARNIAKSAGVSSGDCKAAGLCAPFDRVQITSPTNRSTITYGSPSPTLCKHSEMCIVSGFSAGQGAKARGIGYQEEVSPTLRSANSGTNQVPCIVLDARGNGDGKTVPTLTGDHNRRITDYTALVMGTGQANAEILYDLSPCLNCNHEQPIMAYRQQKYGEYREGVGTLTAGNRTGKTGQTLIALQDQGVRRLTPLECERLQGFPDRWTDIGPWIDSKGKYHRESSDSARYKALGNSIAIPVFTWILSRISDHLDKGAALGSLFDGIGGFPLIWERIHGKGTALWASEIEEFPIAVTKYHFREMK